LKRSIGDVMNKKIADDRLSQWRERRHTKIRSWVISTSTPAGVSWKVQTTNMPFGESFQMMKVHFEFFPIDNLLGHP